MATAAMAAVASSRTFLRPHRLLMPHSHPLGRRLFATAAASASAPVSTAASAGVVDVLRERGLVEATTSEALAAARPGELKVYCGFDPTAESLHLGNLLGLVALSWFRRCGHTAVALVGGATGRVGDPSGKSSERPELDVAAVEANSDAIKSLVAQILGRVPEPAHHSEPGKNEQPLVNSAADSSAKMGSFVILDNYDWWKEITLLDFLKEVGRFARVGTMIAKESVKKRLASEDGMSYTEFTYQLLQGYDFLHMFKNMGVNVQIGGTDQWGNITAGTELIRKILQVEGAHGLTFPLLLKSDGTKFGKTEDGAIWLSSKMLSPYKFYQYFFAVPDVDVIRFMKILTFVSLDEIQELEESMKKPGYVPNTVQKRLAEEVTRFVHGEDGLVEALKATEALRPGAQTQLDTQTIEGIADDVPSCSLAYDQVCMSDQEVADYMKSLAIRVSGFDVPRPIKNFEDCGFPVPLMNAIAKQAYEKPTTIQCQALPIVLSGRDIIGIAKTGSGKTAAFVLPMIVHIMDQPELEKEEGPIGVICAPTRELAHQIYLEAKKFAKPYNLRVAAVYGGVSKFDQFKELKAGCEVVIATPGRLIDLLKMKALKMFRATYLVLDEADRMFDLGFEPQIRSIVGQIRPDRQTLLFSATMPYKVERLAREILTDPIRVTVGQVGSANEDIKQVVNVLPSDVEKMPWLLEKLPGMIDDGDVLVFASKKARVDEIEKELVQRGFRIAALHGDKDQASRMETLQKFKSGIYHVLVATDVAARGLDIKSIKTVVNFDIAKEMDMHIHRIGRTGRAGDKDGTAYTLITQKEARFAGELVHSLIAAGQDVPNELMDLAMKDGRFRAKRDSRKGGKKGGKGKGGGGGGSAGRGRGVRGVDFGLGIGYNAESGSQVPAPRTAAVNSLKTGMMQQFKSSFVSGSSNTPSSSTPSFVRPALRGFVSGGTIGGDTRPAQSAPSVPASRPAQPAPSFIPASQPARNSNENGNPNPESSRDRSRERKRPSGWDR